MGDLEPVYDIFPITSELKVPYAATQTRVVFVKRVVFLMVNHGRLLPLREVHSTDEAIVWRDPGGS